MDVEDCQEDEEAYKEDIKSYAASFGWQRTVFASQEAAPVDRLPIRPSPTLPIRDGVG